MRRIERKIVALCILFVLSLQVMAFVVLNSALNSIAHTHVGSAADTSVINQIITDVIGPYYYLLIALMLVSLVLLLSVSGAIHYAMRVLRLSPKTEVKKKPVVQATVAPAPRAQMPGNLQDMVHVFAMMREILARRENEIKRMANCDALTGLPNRVQFVATLNEAIADGKNNACFVLMMDLDRFKNVNDVMGHTFGDELLRQLARRLTETLPANQLARLGGDEFALLLKNSNLATAVDTAQVLLMLLEHPITIDEQTVDLGAGIGIAGYPSHGDNAEILLSRAELAMYESKRNLGGSYTVYCPEMDHASQQNLSMVSELRHAIAEDQLCLYVQPKFGMKEKTIVGVETLVRWNHPRRGFLVPDKFVVFAEQTGTIRQLTKWMLEKSAQFSRDIAAQGVDMKISVNVSTHDLLDPDLPRKIEEIFVRNQVSGAAFCLEITESAIMNDPQRAQQTMEKLAAMGVELSIDDFGTGYSSLSYLKRLPVSELKIDQSFVLQMIHDRDDCTIVRSTIDLGHNMGLRVVAEGVQCAMAVSLLEKLECDQIQGNYISIPIPASQFPEWLKLRLNEA